MTEQDGENHLATLNLVINLLGILFGFAIAKLCDIFKTYKVLLCLNAINLCFELLLITDMIDHHQQDFSIVYDVSFVLLSSLACSYYSSAIIYLSKICGPTSRATIFSMNGVVGSSGIIVFQSVAGHMYSN